MKNKKILAHTVIVLLLVVPIISISDSTLQLLGTSTNINKPIKKIIDNHYTNLKDSKSYNLKPIDVQLIKSTPKSSITVPETYKVSGTAWSDPPGSWWDTDWEYRVNVTISETAGFDRDDWPVDIFIRFNPPAHKYSIRVVEVTALGFNEIPSQVWNITYFNSTHLSSATVTFLVDILGNTYKRYQIYWSTDTADPPAIVKES